MAVNCFFVRELAAPFVGELADTLNRVENLSVKNGGSLKKFSGGGGSGEHEDARADNGADAQRRQRPGAERLLQTLARSLGFRDQLVDRLAAEKLVVGRAHGAGGFRR